MIFKRHLLFTVFLVIIGLLLSYKLIFNPRPLYDWDESLYVQNGLEMIKNRSFLVPSWQNNPWLDKPPLSPLLFGIVATVVPLPIEISTRLFTLALALTALTLIYALYYKATKNRLVATLTVIITFFLPIFLQRSQVVSLDVTLLIGWLGFFLFLDKPLLSVLFLLLSVQSKSLLGFYPLVVSGGFLVFQYLTRKITAKKLFLSLKTMAGQTAFLLIWYLLAFLIYKQDFWNLHIIESHFRRVSSSLESHFGQRTFYLDLLLSQLGWLSVFSGLGFVISLSLWLKKKISNEIFLLQNAYLPWFVFLNLTKTKISWYLYPVLPQFAFYTANSLTLIPKKIWQTVILIGAGCLLFYNGVVTQKLLTTFYSAEDAHIKAAKFAKQKCRDLAVLVPNYTRETYHTLKKMNLTITTTSWWGEHPSMVFYFQKPLTFFYDVPKFKKELPHYRCVILNENDQQILVKSPLTKLKSFDKMLLYKK